jgi:hypothetical protein
VNERNGALRLRITWSLIAVIIAACEAAPAASGLAVSVAPSSAPPTAMTTIVTPTETPIELEGRLFFARYDLELDDMTVWVANGDGSDARPFVPGVHYLSCAMEGEIVMAGPNAAGRLVVSVASGDGSRYAELDVGVADLNLGVGACPATAGVVLAEGWVVADPERTGIYRVDIYRGKARQVTEAPAGHHDIPGCVTADGRLAFLRAGTGNEMGTLNLLDLDGGDAREIGDRRWKTGPACSPDGGSLLVEADGDLVLVDIASGEATELTSGAPEFAKHKYLPAFGPGGIVAFSLKHPGPFHDLYAMRLDGSGLTRLTRTEVDNESPYWVVDP